MLHGLRLIIHEGVQEEDAWSQVSNAPRKP